MLVAFDFVKIKLCIYVCNSVAFIFLKSKLYIYVCYIGCLSIFGD